MNYRTFLRTPPVNRNHDIGIRKPSRKRAQEEVQRLISLITSSPPSSGSSSGIEETGRGPQEVIDLDSIGAGVADYVIPCVPPPCRPLVERFSQGVITFMRGSEPPGPVVFSADQLWHIGDLLKGLVAPSSIIVMLPWDAVPHIRLIVADSDSAARQPLNPLLEDVCPEVFRALSSTSGSGLAYALVLEFVKGLIDELEFWARTLIEPPPFEEQPGSFCPEITGSTYRMRPSGQQGRPVRRYADDGELDAVEESAGGCNKLYNRWQRRTGGIFMYLFIS